MPDEQITGDADQFPKDEQHQKVVRQHDAEHRESEQAQSRKIAGEPAVIAHVTPGVNVDRAADASDDEQHQQAEGIEPQAEVHLQFANLQPDHERFPPLRQPSVRRNEKHAQQETGNNCPDGKLCAQLTIVLSEQHDDGCREQRQEQDEPG